MLADDGCTETEGAGCACELLVEALGDAEQPINARQAAKSEAVRVKNVTRRIFCENVSAAIGCEAGLRFLEEAPKRLMVLLRKLELVLLIALNNVGPFRAFGDQSVFQRTGSDFCDSRGLHLSPALCRCSRKFPRNAVCSPRQLVFLTFFRSDSKVRIVTLNQIWT